MTRSADEFLFGRNHFTRILRNARLRRKVHLHLHVTAQAPNKDAAAMLFREALKRQSKIDHKAYSELAEKQSLQEIAGPLLPWCWANGASEDLLWVTDLVDVAAISQQDVDQCQRSYASHWGRSFVKSNTAIYPSCSNNSSIMKGQDADALKPNDGLVPIVFGRPNFASEIRAIGKARPGTDVNVYVCGNDAVVRNLFDVAAVCNQRAEADLRTGNSPKQSYHVHFERFG